MHFAQPIDVIDLRVKVLNLITEELVVDSAVCDHAAFDHSIAATGDKPARGIAQHSTDGLDPELVTIQVPVSDHLDVGRSNRGEES